MSCSPRCVTSTTSKSSGPRRLPSRRSPPPPFRADPVDRFDRIFELNRILQAARYPVSRQRLQDELECSRATIKRLIEDMRLHLNAPIVYDRDTTATATTWPRGRCTSCPVSGSTPPSCMPCSRCSSSLTSVQPGLLDQHLKPLQKRIADLLELQRPGSTGSRPCADHADGRAPRRPHFQTVAGTLAQRQRLWIRYFNRGDDRPQRARGLAPASHLLPRQLVSRRLVSSARGSADLRPGCDRDRAPLPTSRRWRSPTRIWTGTSPSPTASSPGCRSRRRCCDSAPSAPAGSRRSSGTGTRRAVPGGRSLRAAHPLQQRVGADDGRAQVRPGRRGRAALDRYEAPAPA
jgi:hypothetical protein